MTNKNAAGEAFLHFVREHLSIDMTAAEIARHYKTTVVVVLGVVGMTGAGAEFSRLSRPTALHTPFTPVIAKRVRKATWVDHYQPISMEEFHERWPDGRRHHPWPC